MDARFCDRCNVLWVDKAECEVDIKTIHISKGSSHSDKIGSYDLCKDCFMSLFDFFHKKTPNENKANFTFKFESGYSVALGLYQSPRGVRYEDKRPNLIVIDCYLELSPLQLIKYIDYLQTLVHSMELQTKQKDDNQNP